MADEKLLYDLECQDEMKGRPQPKAIFAGDSYVGQPALIVTDEEVALIGDKNNAIAVNPDYGVFLSGKTISFSAMPHQLLFGGGYYRLDPRHTSCLPSTSPTPLPLLMRATPPLLRARRALQDEVKLNLEPYSDLML